MSMENFMEVLREYSQLVNKTNEILSYDISSTPMLDKMSDIDLEYIANHSNFTSEITKVGELAELVFQLNDYVPAVMNYVKIFLYANHFTYVMEFISKLYASHVNGASYVSKPKPSNIKERLFDRFIELVIVGEIASELYLPLILSCIFEDKSPLYFWHDIAMEYMQNYMREHEDELDIFMTESNQYILQYITLLLSFNTQKGISIIFNDMSHKNISEENSEYFLKKYLNDTLSYFDKYLSNSGALRFHYIKILAGIKNNVEVDSRLEKIYDEETDEEIKEFLSHRLGISETLSFGTESHFSVLAKRKVKQPQERTLGIAFENLPLIFKSGKEANAIDKTYLIDIFKEEKNLLNLSSLKSLYDVFDESSLNSFVEKLFDKHCKNEDILSSKWCVRMFALFSNGLFERKVFEFLYALYKLSRSKEANYLTLCLCYAQKPNFIEMLKRLQQFNNFKVNIEEYIKIYSVSNKRNVEEIKDLILPEVLSDNEIEKEVQRLYNNFISHRTYSKEMFNKLFIYHKIFNMFANRLVFGEYKQGKLYSIFLVKNQDIVYIYGNRQEGDDVVVSLVHTLDLDERFENINLKLENALFEQFRRSKIDIRDFNRASMSVGNFVGTIVDGAEFVKHLKNHGFVPNIKDGEVQFTSMVCENNILNLLVEISFQKPITTISPVATLDSIRFYRLSEVMRDQQKYITIKSQSLSLGGVEERYFDYILSLIKD